jgi:hypothetical protein
MLAVMNAVLMDAVAGIARHLAARRPHPRQQLADLRRDRFVVSVQGGS